MAFSHVELYEALKPTIGEKAASLMAEVVPPAADLATKHDIAQLQAATKHDIAQLQAATKHDIAELRTATQQDIAELKAATQQDITELKAELKADIARLDAQFPRLEAKIDASAREVMRSMLTFFVPVWAGTWAAVIAILLRG